MKISARLAAGAALFALAALAGTVARSETAFGCRGLMTSGLLAAVEGADGQFYRLYPDLQSDHRIESGAIAQIAALSRALASRGTTLVYVPVPTKALAMPAALPTEAGHFGYDPDIAATLYDLTLRDLRAAGIASVDARHALRTTRGGDAPVFRTDPRLTASGAEALAAATARTIADLPDYDSMPKTSFRSRMDGTDILESHIRLMLQENCAAPLPLVEAERHTTLPGGTATLAAADGTIQRNAAGIVVVGTQIAGLRPSNFAGFLSGYSGLDARSYAGPETEPFTAISSYLMSDEFAAAPPFVLVWTNPVWNNLASHGDQPMRELIAAAGTTCDVPLPLSVDRQGVAHADLTRIGADPRLTLRLDSASAAQEAVFEFRGWPDRTRIRPVRRAPGQDTRGRFYMPLTGLWPEGVESVSITLPGSFGRDAELTLCNGEG